MQTTDTPLELAADELRRQVDLASLDFETTADVPPLEGTIGQPRAVDALDFGLDMAAEGFNVFVGGAVGSGRESTVRASVERVAAARPVPSDWVYVHNFVTPDCPIAIALEAGRGPELARDLDAFIRAAQGEIPRAFDSEDYAQRRRATVGDLEEQREAVLRDLQSFARERSFALEMTPAGIMTVPIVNGQPLTREAFEPLPTSAKEQISQRGEEIQAAVGASLRQVRQLEQATAEKIQQLDRTVALFVVGPHLDELRQRYAGAPGVLEFIDQIENDLPHHLNDFRGAPAAGESPVDAMTALHKADHLARYRVNVLIDNSKTSGAPVVFERNPTYYNLTGRIDYRAAFGAVMTDFQQIKPGALHRANGGFLVLSVLDLLRNPFAWDTLKRALLNREVRIENLSEQLTLFPSTTLRPAPIPLSLKVILIGPIAVYELLRGLDEQVAKLFKVRAEFAPDMPWDEENVRQYASFISRHALSNGLRPFDRGAVGRLIELGARRRASQRKLSTGFLEIADLATEAEYWANRSGHAVVTAADVEQAIEKRSYRANLIEERARDLVADGTLLIDTAGERVGQVNGLSVIGYGDHAFGQPVRISARVAPGRGAVQSIEREIKLSGPIHSKGVLILGGYLAGKYAQRVPLTVAATITFEQSYDEVEGDSASSAELYALISALAGVPLAQGIAVTGSVNQSGEIQAVGGVTEKIEGFFDVCRQRGLTGRQGVVIPTSNRQHLMLKESVVEAVRSGRFHIWAISTVDEGLALLTGQPPGEPDGAGEYPTGSIHGRAVQALERYGQVLRAVQAVPDLALAGQNGPVAAP